MTKNGGTAESYTLDSLNRLTNVTYADGTTQAYTYDANGNRLTKTQGGATTTYTYNNGDQLTSDGSATYTYDLNGNLVAKGSGSFAWDYASGMTGATVGGTAAERRTAAPQSRTGTTQTAAPYRWRGAEMRVSWIGSLSLIVLVAVACGDDDDDVAKVERLGDQPVNDHGTMEVSDVSSVAIEAGDFYFQPTFIRGTAGQKLTLKIENESSVRHNLSVAGTIDEDVEPGGKIEVDVTFPASGVALFFCKYHIGQGMVGELLVGDAEPSAAPAASSPATGPADPY